ncbi:MAG: sigma-54-dependent Fis family transcriptional regulator [Flavobacteriales bacterium]|nr:sigma-54-dependent Fis family transcriptional regulator [Flavobacteriales bacterium]
MDVQAIKQRFGIIGNSPGLNRALHIATQVAPTDISVLVSGESGTGKEVMPQIIHNLSHRKHNKYIAVNCGALPEGTIDSELFGHVKGSFTGASGDRAGYFEEADGGTIFLDEVAEMPLQTQVRLLRVLESGEIIRVGSSKIQKTDVRIIAATNKNIPEEIDKGKFREDLYYRLNTVPLELPPLRERKEDIDLIFRKFAVDFSDKYRMPMVQLDDEARDVLINYRWPGNIRQLRNVTEQISVIEGERRIDRATLIKYLPDAYKSRLPVLVKDGSSQNDLNEREILYKVLFDMKKDLNQVKSLVLDMIDKGGASGLTTENTAYVQQMLKQDDGIENIENTISISSPAEKFEQPMQTYEEVDESLSLADKEKEFIVKALKKHKNKRKYAAQDLGISERTLYRKIKEYNI